jgi:hypothetical protein
MTGYALTLLCHSYLRWIITVLALFLIARAAAGMSRASDWSRLDERLHMALIASVDTQFMLGLWLYFVASPIPDAFLVDIGVSMRQPILRFFGLEHPLGMLVAVSLFHIGRTRSKKAANAQQRHRRVFGFTLAAVVVAAASMPWPILDTGRPLFR